ncbi:MAG: iron ABC transporter permease [Thermoanaerobaculales bacterium]|nr:iron ABC transporter permease [Thermoanaerobaculales bacterium]
MKTPLRLVVLGGLAIFGLAALPLVGRQALPLSALFDLQGVDPAGVIFWQIRVPRALAAFVGGAGLALGGAVFQAIFRNPLATPYTLGVASGASLGVALASRFGLSLVVVGLSTTSVAAFAGAMVAVTVIWVLTRLRPELSSTTLLLAGVAMNFYFSSVILFAQYTASLGDSYRIVRWLMGGLGGVGMNTVVHMVPVVTLGAVVILWHARELDLLATGSEIAASRGVAVAPTRTLLFLATSVMVGGVVAACGPVGFVGMMAPHICRLLVGSNHRVLLPASILFGGAFLVLCDTAARLVLFPAELPVGVITAFLGAPFFLWLLVRQVGSPSARL